MFTGIIEEIGTVRKVSFEQNGAVISISCSEIAKDMKIGDSICVDGVCTTVESFDSGSFSFTASAETINLTTFKTINSGKKVNLERALRPIDRLGGHIVSGHIDAKGEFINKSNQGSSWLYYFIAPKEIAKYIVYKGSIAVNGISLTVASIDDTVFSVALIPHTLASTSLGTMIEGDKVNLECDILAKYIEKLAFNKDNNEDDITFEFLERHGF